MASIGTRTLLGTVVLGIASCRAVSPRSADQWEVERFTRLGRAIVAALGNEATGYVSQAVRYVVLTRQGGPQLLVGAQGLPVAALDEFGHCYVECDKGDCLLRGQSGKSITTLPAACRTGAVVACASERVLLACDGRLWKRSMRTWEEIHWEPDATIARLLQIDGLHAVASYRHVATHPEVFSGGLLRVNGAVGRVERFRLGAPRQEEVFVDELQRSLDGAIWLLEEPHWAAQGYPSRLARLDAYGAWFVMTRRRRPGKTQIRAFDVSNRYAWVVVQTYGNGWKDALKVTQAAPTRLRLLRSAAQVDEFDSHLPTVWSGVDVSLQRSPSLPEAPVVVTSLLVRGGEAWLGTSGHGVAVVDLDSGDVLDWIGVGPASHSGLQALDMQANLPHTVVSDWIRP